MARSLSTVAALAAFLVVRASAMMCPMAFNTGSVGSCMIGDCAESRGPVHCKMGGCYCNEGYCRFPASTMHVRSRYCVARIPGAHCHVSRVCWTGGLDKSFCEKGLCMCKFGLIPTTGADGSIDCVPDGHTGLAAAFARNATAEEIEMITEHTSHSESMVNWNVAIATCWMCGCFAAVAGVVGFFVMRKKRDVQVTVEPYESLLG